MQWVRDQISKNNQYYNREFIWKELIRVEEGRVGTTLQYDEEDRLIRTKFNKNYFVEVDKIVDYNNKFKDWTTESG